MPIHAHKKKAIVVGAGIAGLAAAIRMTAKGYDVSVFEKNEGPGGKLSQFSLGAYRFDFGPSLFTMPNYVEELFHLSDANPSDYFSYISLKEACRYFFSDGKTFIAPTDPSSFAKSASKTFGTSEKKINKYFKYNQGIYDNAGKIFLTKSIHKLSTFLSKEAIKATFQLYLMDLFRSMHASNSSILDDPNLIQLFDRYATYNGSSPYRAPGILNSISILEHIYGTYFPVGGMFNITNSIYTLAKQKGVKFYFNQKVDEILVSENKAYGITSNGTRYQGDVIISNMDVTFTYQKLLNNKALPYVQRNQEKSSSAVIFYWGIKKQFSELGLHNIFFSANYKEEFDYIFDKKSISSDPTVYVNISSVYNPEDAPLNCSNWFVMINAPGDFGQDWSKEVSDLRRNVIHKLSTKLKVNIAELIEEEYVVDPSIIESKTLSHRGSLYGSSSNNWVNAFLRHPNFSSKIKDLYFVGGSVHPGGGIPLCLLSSKITSELITNA